MEFENHESINSLKNARITMDHLKDTLGPEYDLSTAMIAFYDPQDLDDLCEETRAFSEVRLDWITFARQHDIEHVNNLEEKGYVPSLDERKKIYEMYKLYSILDDSFDSNEDITVHEMERKIINRIYDEEELDSKYFIETAERIDDKRRQYSKALRWSASLFFAASASLFAFGVARSVEDQAMFTENQKETYELSIVLGGVAIGARIGESFKRTNLFRHCSKQYSQIVAQKVMANSIRKRVESEN